MTPRNECEEAIRLSAEWGMNMAEYHQSKDDLAMTSKRDPKYSQKLKEFRAAQGRVNDSRRRWFAHVREHGCELFSK
jgi:hypothetical protein